MTLNCTVKNGSNDKKETEEGKKKEKKRKIKHILCLGGHMYMGTIYIHMYGYTYYILKLSSNINKAFLNLAWDFFLFSDLCRVCFSSIKLSIASPHNSSFSPPHLRTCCPFSWSAHKRTHKRTYTHCHSHSVWVLAASIHPVSLSCSDNFAWSCSFPGRGDFPSVVPP